MIVLPFQIDNERYSVLLALDDEGLQRVKQYDPAELVLDKLGEPWTHLKLKDVLVTYCNAQDLKRVQELSDEGNPQAAYRYLTRGWVFRPDLGDHDNPPTSLKRKPH